MEMIFTILIFALIGAGIFRLDMWFINLVSKKGKPEHEKKGLVVRRQLPMKLIVAVVVIVIKLYLVAKIFGAHTNNETIIVYTLLEYASIVIGFYIAPWVIAKLPAAMKKSQKYIEDVETGKINPVTAAKNKINEVTSPLHIKTNVAVEEKIIEVSPAEPSIEIKETIEEVKTDNRTAQQKMSDAVKEFTKK